MSLDIYDFKSQYIHKYVYVLMYYIFIYTFIDISTYIYIQIFLDVHTLIHVYLHIHDTSTFLFVYTVCTCRLYRDRQWCTEKPLMSLCKLMRVSFGLFEMETYQSIRANVVVRFTMTWVPTFKLLGPLDSLDSLLTFGFQLR